MSELVTKIRICGNHTQFEISPILKEIAKYNKPHGINSVGTFELKPEFYTEFDPYFNVYGKFTQFFPSTDEQSAAIENYMNVTKSQMYNKLNANQKKSKKLNDMVVMFPNWPHKTLMMITAVPELRWIAANQLKVKQRARSVLVGTLVQLVSAIDRRSIKISACNWLVSVMPNWIKP